MKATVRYAAAGTALALLTAAIPATYAVNSVINPARAECATTGGRLIDVAFLNTFVPTWTEGAPTSVNKGDLQFTMDGNVYNVRHYSELETVTPGEIINVAYVLEGGKRYVVSLTQKDPEKYEGADRINLRDDLELNNDIPDNVAG